MMQSETVYRIHWKLGTDQLVGVCYCGAEHESGDPVELWEWLLAHPRLHDGDGNTPSSPSQPAGAGTR